MSRLGLAMLAAMLGVLAPAALAQAPAAPPPAPAPGAPAQEPAAPVAPAHPPGYHTHDGFFLQLNAGFGSMVSKASSGGTDWEFSGAAGEFGIAIGYAVTPNFILAGDLWGVAGTEPKVKADGTSIGSTDSALDLSGVGLNLTYYFMPIGVYLTAVPSIGVLSPKAWGTSHSTDAGLALRLAVGKEWWVSDNWGLGLNVQYAHSSNKDKDFPDKPTWRTDWFGIAFSATYN